MSKIIFALCEASYKIWNKLKNRQQKIRCWRKVWLKMFIFRSMNNLIHSFETSGFVFIWFCLIKFAKDWGRKLGTDFFHFFKPQTSCFSSATAKGGLITLPWKTSDEWTSLIARIMLAWCLLMAGSKTNFELKSKWIRNCVVLLYAAIQKYNTISNSSWF